MYLSVSQLPQQQSRLIKNEIIYGVYLKYSPEMLFIFCIPAGKKAVDKAVLSQHTFLRRMPLL